MARALVQSSPPEDAAGQSQGCDGQSSATRRCRLGSYPMINIQKTIEHGTFIVDVPIQSGVIFLSYVCLPKGKLEISPWSSRGVVGGFMLWDFLGVSFMGISGGCGGDLIKDPKTIDYCRNYCGCIPTHQREFAMVCHRFCSLQLHSTAKYLVMLVHVLVSFCGWKKS